MHPLNLQLWTFSATQTIECSTQQPRWSPKATECSSHANGVRRFRDCGSRIKIFTTWTQKIQEGIFEDVPITRCLLIYVAFHDRVTSFIGLWFWQEEWSDGYFQWMDEGVMMLQEKWLNDNSTRLGNWRNKSKCTRLWWLFHGVWLYLYWWVSSKSKGL